MEQLPTRIYGEGNNFDVSENVRYLGDKAVNRLIPGSRKTANPYGAEELTRRYKCHRSREAQFDPRPGDVDFQHRSMRYVTHDTEYEACHCIFTIIYNGFTNNNRPRNFKPVWRTRNRELIINYEGAVYRAFYRSPYVETKYAALDEPPDSEGFAAFPRGGAKIFELRTPNDVPIVNGAAIAEAITGYALVKPYFHRSIFERKPVGTLYHVDETVELLLGQQPIDINIPNPAE